MDLESGSKVAECPLAQGGLGPEAEEVMGNQKSLSESSAYKENMERLFSFVLQLLYSSAVIGS